MSLDRNKLAQAFAQWFSRPGDIFSTAQAEQRLAEIYDAYAQQAEDVSGDGSTSLSRSDFETRLNFQRSRSADDFCRQVDAAFVAYWTDTTFATNLLPPVDPPCPNVGGTGEFSSETTSQVVEVTANMMHDKLLPLLTRASTSARIRAQEMAAVMHEVTTSAVTVLITGEDTGSPTPSSITNECGVF